MMEDDLNGGAAAIRNYYLLMQLGDQWWNYERVPAAGHAKACSITVRNSLSEKGFVINPCGLVSIAR